MAISQACAWFREKYRVLHFMKKKGMLTYCYTIHGKKKALLTEQLQLGKRLNFLFFFLRDAILSIYIEKKLEGATSELTALQRRRLSCSFFFLSRLLRGKSCIASIELSFLFFLLLCFLRDIDLLDILESGDRIVQFAFQFK